MLILELHGAETRRSISRKDRRPEEWQITALTCALACKELPELIRVDELHLLSQLLGLARCILGLHFRVLPDLLGFLLSVESRFLQPSAPPPSG